jgi:acyl-CoA synthetase (AMP-forming)/AMP-acid ligase II
MDIEGLTIPALLHDRAGTAGGAIALVHDEERLSYREIDAASREMARRLVACGVGPRQRVALLLENGPEWAILAYGALRIGAVLVPLSTLLRPTELLAQLRQSGASHLIAAPTIRGREPLAELDSVAPGIIEVVRASQRDVALPTLQRVWTSDSIPTEPAPEAVVEALERAVRPADDLLVLFTSGSRGAQRRTPYPWQRPARRRQRSRSTSNRPRRAALHPDALLLDRRTRRRAADCARRRGHAARRVQSEPGKDARLPRAGAGDDLPRLAGSGSADRS